MGLTTCAGCQQCEAGPVATLVDGRTVCTSCEDWRRECEARAVLAMPSLAKRREYLYGVQETQMRHGKPVMVWAVKGVKQTRGQQAVEYLETAIREVWAKTRPA